MRTPKNHFKVGVRFPDIAFGVENAKDATITPQVVVEALEAFCGCVRKELARRQLPAPEAPHD